MNIKKIISILLTIMFAFLLSCRKNNDSIAINIGTESRTMDLSFNILNVIYS